MKRTAAKGLLGRKRGLLTFAVLVALLIVAMPASAFAAQILWFTHEPNLPQAVSTNACAAVGTEIWSVGGAGANGLLRTEIDIYDTVGKTWTANARQLPMPLRSAIADTYGQYIFAVAGQVGAGGPANTTDQILRIDTLSTGPGSIQVVGNIQIPRWGARGQIIGNRFFIVGGRDSSSGWLSSIEAFDILGGGTSVASLGTVANFPSGRAYTGTFEYNGMLRIAGGKINNTTKVADTFQLDPSTFALTQLSPMSEPMHTRRFNQLSNGVFYDVIGELGHVYAFDPSQPQGSRWSVAGSYPNPRNVMENCQVGDAIYLVGGQPNAGGVTDDVDKGVLAVTNATASAPSGAPGVPQGFAVGTKNVTLTFPAGTIPGQVTVAEMGNTPPGGVPGAFSVAEKKTLLSIYDIATSADLQGGALTVRLPYSGKNGKAALKHWNGGVWEDYTSRITNQATCGTPDGYIEFSTTALSPFAVGESTETSPTGGGSGTTSVPADSSWTLGLLALGGIAAGAWGLRRRPAGQ